MQLQAAGHRQLQGVQVPQRRAVHHFVRIGRAWVAAEPAPLPLQKRTSHCYRIAYRSMERSLTDDEINDLQTKTRQVLEKQMGVELR